MRSVIDRGEEEEKLLTAHSLRPSPRPSQHSSSSHSRQPQEPPRPASRRAVAPPMRKEKILELARGFWVSALRPYVARD